MNNKVSIIMPVYNCEKYLDQAIKSVLKQSYKNFELIIVDDFSADNSVNIINKYLTDERVKLYKLKENSGASSARNYALKKANGRFIAYLDADDYWDLNKLKIQINYMLKNKYAFTCTNYIALNDTDQAVKKIIVPTINYRTYLKNTIIQTVGVVVDLKYIPKDCLVAPKLKRRQDMAIWLNVLKISDCYGVNEYLSYYRRHRNSLSSNKIKASKATWYVYRNIEKLSFFDSVCCFIMYAFNAIKKRI